MRWLIEFMATASIKRSLVACMAGWSLAASAHAVATIDVSSLTGNSLPAGSLITLQVHVTTTPAEGADASLFGALLYPSSGIVTPVTPASQFAFPSDGAPFGVGASSCTSVRCVMLNQTAGIQGPQTGSVTNFLIATQTYMILPGTLPGTVLTWNWQTSPSTATLSFYNAVPTVPALSITVIPEPTTAALLGIGLLGLTAARRRR